MILSEAPSGERLDGAPTYSIVIPVYASAQFLDELHTRLTATMDAVGEPYEIVFVNDDGPDDSLSVLHRLHEADARVVVIDLMRNAGQHSALMAGFSVAAGRYVVTMDDDLQHPPEEIPRLIAAMATNEADVVIGRYNTKQHAGYRNLGSWAMKALSWYTLGVPRNLDLTSFRLMHRRVVDAVVDFHGPRPRVGLIVFQVTRRIINVDVEHHPRRKGASSYALRKLVASAIDNVVNYSALPLRLLAGLGCITAAASTLLAVGYIVLYLAGGIAVSGFTTLVLLMLFFMGLTMAAFGIVGEYMIRIVSAAERRPRYIVREIYRAGRR